MVKMTKLFRRAAFAAMLVSAAAALLVSCEKIGADRYSPQDLELDELIQNYVSASYTSKISDVTVTGDKVRISGTYAGTGEFRIAEVPPYMDLLKLDEPLSVLEPDSSEFSVETGRWLETADGIVYDRLLSKWAIFEKDGDSWQLVSAARYADTVPAISSPEAVPLRNKKGLGGIFMNEHISDLDELDTGSATLNFFVTQFTYLSPGDGRIEHRYGGRSYWFDENFIRRNLDRVLEETFRFSDFAVRKSPQTLGYKLITKNLAGLTLRQTKETVKEGDPGLFDGIEGEGDDKS